MRTRLTERGTCATPFSDFEIRAALRKNLIESLGTDKEAVILDELGLRHGMVRVDLVVVNGTLHGYELKSDRDTLRRLPRQASTYSQVLDFITLVAGERHMQNAIAMVPDWWGVSLVRCKSHHTVEFSAIRQPRENPSPDKLYIAKLLWRAEALGVLEEMHAADGFRSKPRTSIYLRLIELLGIDELRDRVRHKLRTRTDWRSGGQQMSYDD